MLDVQNLGVSFGGEVLFEGRDILKMNSADLTELRKDMQIIFQDPYFYCVV